MDSIACIQDITIDQLYYAATPLFKALYPYAIMLWAFVFVWWLIGKIMEWQKGNEPFLGLISKALTLMFILFMWPHIFIGSYLLNDAWAARVEEIDISSSLPASVKTYISDQGLATNFENALQSLETQVVFDKTSDKLGEAEQVEEPEKKGWFQQNIDNFSLAVQSAPELILKRLIGFMAGIAKNVVLTIRLILSVFYYIAIPFLFVLSFLPIIGDNKGSEALNSYSKKTLSWFLNMAMWPTIYALLDKVFLLLYYMFIANGLFENMSILVAFYCTYIILVVTLPMAIANANPYGIVQGTIAAMQTVATMAAVGAVSGVGMGKTGATAGAKGIGHGAKGLAGAIAAVRKFRPKSNVDLAGGS